MARTTKTGISYFPFDTDFFTDTKIRFVTARFSDIGALVAIKLLCQIYRNGYYIHWDNDEAALFTSISGTTLQDTKNIIEELLKRNFFDQALYDTYGILTSRGIQTRYFEAVRRYKHVEINQNYILIDYTKIQNFMPALTENDEASVDINSQNVNLEMHDVDINSQKRREEKKRKKNKKDQKEVAKVADATTTTLGDDFNSFILEPLSTNNCLSTNLMSPKPMSPALKAVWEILINQPRWKNKTPQSLQMTQKQLSEFDEEFAIRLIENAISSNYQGVIFPNTHTDYQKWLESKRSTSSRTLEEILMEEFNQL